MKTQWANHPEVQEKKTGENSYTWEMENVPAVEVEPEMPPWRVIAGRMGVKYFPTATSPAAKTSGSWKDIALWYSGLTTTSRDATPEIKQKVAELTANAPTTYAKIKALTDFMQRQIRYVAIEIGIGGFQPHPASTVFQYQIWRLQGQSHLAQLHAPRNRRRILLRRRASQSRHRPSGFSFARLFQSHDSRHPPCRTVWTTPISTPSSSTPLSAAF